MKKIFLITLVLGPLTAPAQRINKLIKVSEVTRIETTLSSDAMAGRKTFSAGIDKAAAFIAEEFSKAGLQYAGNNNSFLQSFSMIESAVVDGNATLDGTSIPASQIICQTSLERLAFSEVDAYEVVRIGATDNFMQTYRGVRGKTNNLLVLIDTAHRAIFERLKRGSGPRFPSLTNQVYVLTANTQPSRYQVAVSVQLNTHQLANVVGIIPGKSKPDEYVIFSGHYDHLGIGKPNEKGDSIYNGANDDASGTTAVMVLANYFSKLRSNERTLIFAAFTAEEVGGFGSQYFSRQYQPEQVKAMFNIEMIGTDSKWGAQSAYITGYEKTDMGALLEKNLVGTAFKFYPDPYPDQQLFYRSDNATLARLGVPAHTISTSKMDNEPHYHKASDEILTLDLKNMTEVIKAIALSSRTIVAGKDTPSRVITSQLSR